MSARILPAAMRLFAMLALLLGALSAQAQRPEPRPNIEAELIAEGAAVPGETVTLALLFTPRTDEWHGYWANPGDAGYGMQLDWQLPAGWSASEPRYPVPKKLLIGELMNHVYEGRYAVLVDLKVPPGAALGNFAPVQVKAQWLACTDKICVPEQATLTLRLPTAEETVRDARFDRWRSAIPPPLDRPAAFEIADERVRIAIPLPAAMEVGEAHVFVENTDLVDYAAVQSFSRDGDLLIAEIPLGRGEVPDALRGILMLGAGDGVQFSALPGAVPANGIPLPNRGGRGLPSLWLALLGAFAGGLLLNLMPCVFPILSLKALSLARAGESQRQARLDGLAYTAGVVLACLVLGALLLALRSAGENVGWAFQLQEPAVVVALLVLALTITANFLGWFELPGLPITRSGSPAGAFATGLLAAFVATPCTGPFMAAAMGAALLLPKLQALALFAMLGLGLALPFLAIGFVPALRRLLPRPGGWMVTFRKIMAIPMALTALALVWLCWRLGGALFALTSFALAMAAMALLATLWGRPVGERIARRSALVTLAGLSIAMAAFATSSFHPPEQREAEGLLAAAPFSEARLARARAAGRPVFVWFTADWCVTCKVNESVAIEREATRDAFAEAGVVVLRGDWTRRQPEITAFLTARGAAGVPLYLWYPPGRSAQQLPQVLTPDSLVNLAQALPARPQAGQVPPPALQPAAERSGRSPPAVAVAGLR